MLYEREALQDSPERRGGVRTPSKVTKAVSVVRELHLLPFFPIRVNLESEVRDGTIPYNVINDLASGSVNSDRVMNHFFGEKAESMDYMKTSMRRAGKRRQVANLSLKIKRKQGQIRRLSEDDPLRARLEANLARQITARDRIFWGKIK